jgi:hypothetical protein
MRTLIKKNIEEIETHGPALRREAQVAFGSGVEKRITEFWLTEPQALAVCALSRAPKAKAVRTMLIQVFMAWPVGQRRAPRRCERRKGESSDDASPGQHDEVGRSQAGH